MNFVDWGLIYYNRATRRQLDFVEKIVLARSDVNAEGSSDTVIFCSHPPIVTVGRATEASDLGDWQGEIVEASRGGRATYHGPSQLVAYPILDLSLPRRKFGARDLHGYMRALETAVVEALAEFGISASGGQCTTAHGGTSRTGVWVANGSKKIASIGIACRKWVVYHGVALNIAHDTLAFSGINPCGMQTSVMTSIEEVLGCSVAKDQVTQAVRRSLETILNN